MASYRAVDPFGPQRRRRRARSEPTPDVNAGELPAVATLADRIAAADAALGPATEPQEPPPVVDGGAGAHVATEAALAEPDAPAGWPGAVEAATALRVDPAEVRRRCREGELPARKDLSGAWRIDPAALA